MIERDLKVFDLVEFEGSGNVASVRKISGSDDPVVTLRYMMDDGELEYYPFEMRAATVRKLCTLVDVVEKLPTSGRSSKRTAAPGEERRVVYTPLQRWTGSKKAEPGDDAKKPAPRRARMLKMTQE